MAVKLDAVVLDAMGVIYSVGDDVKDLLYPFIAENGGYEDPAKVQSLYNSASLGHINACDFWKAVGITPELEDEYLSRHRLTNGLVEFLKEITIRGYDVWCLSNDLPEWSKKLRTRFALDNYFKGFVISGDIGIRKPDPAIFNALISQLCTDPSRVLIVDDRLYNLNSAVAFGFETVYFDSSGINIANRRHKIVSNFDQLLSLLP